MDSVDKALVHLQEVRKVCDKNRGYCERCPYFKFCNYLRDECHVYRGLGSLIRINYRDKGLINEDSLNYE